MFNKLASDADLLEQIEEFCSKNAMGVTTFGRASIGDPNLVSGLRNGRSLTLKTANAVLEFMVSYSPSCRVVDNETNPRAPEQAA